MQSSYEFIAEIWLQVEKHDDVDATIILISIKIEALESALFEQCTDEEVKALRRLKD